MSPKPPRNRPGDQPPTIAVAPQDPTPEARLIGATDQIQRLNEQIERAARADAKVLITGETGAGKEVVARLIHQRSARSARPLVTLNCAGVPESLLESELFGHVRGAFTGAIRDKRGLLETAANGTVFLDEIGEMSLRMQSVLLRFLQNGEIQRVGSDRAHTRVNVRLIAATNRNLAEEIVAGTFREDFYFRLNVISIDVPPLRERLSDVPLLIDYLLDLVQSAEQPRITLAPETIDLLTRYRWPGNVRELRNLLERLVVNARGPVVQPSDLPAHIHVDEPAPAAIEPAQTAPATGPALVNELAARMLVHGESFWSAVADPFSSGRLSREDVKRIVRLGLERTHGSHRNLVALFNVAPDDHARFLSFLQENDCHLPPHGLRSERHKAQGPRLKA